MRMWLGIRFRGQAVANMAVCQGIRLRTVELQPCSWQCTDSTAISVFVLE
jgi:hypothetical protein